jgi:hypothetical protein
MAKTTPPAPSTPLRKPTRCVTSPPKLDRLSEAAGFERITAEELLTEGSLSETTWGVCLVLRKHH